MNNDSHCCCLAQSQALRVTTVSVTHTVVSRTVGPSDFRQTLEGLMANGAEHDDSENASHRGAASDPSSPLAWLLENKPMPIPKSGMVQLERLFLLARSITSTAASTQVKHLEKTPHAECVLDYLSHGEHSCKQGTTA